MPPTWFGGPPNGHPGMHQQPGRPFHPQQQQGAAQQQQQRMAAAGMNAPQGGITSPHGHAAAGHAYQRSSPPLRRDPYRGPAGLMGPGGYPQQHMAAGGRPGGARHLSISPGMTRRMPMPPPNAMRPIPQSAASRGHFDPQAGMQGGGHLGGGGMTAQQQQHMMRTQQHEQQRASHGPSSSENNSTAQQQRGAEGEMPEAPQECLESAPKRPVAQQQQPPATPKEQRSINNGNISRSPSPPPVPPTQQQEHHHPHPHMQHQHPHHQHHGGGGMMHPQMQQMHMGGGQHISHQMHHPMHMPQMSFHHSYHHHHPMHHPGGPPNAAHTIGSNTSMDGSNNNDNNNMNQRPSPAALPQSDSMMSDHTNNTGVDEPPAPPSLTKTPPVHNNNSNNNSAWGGGVNNPNTNGPNSAGPMAPLRESRLQNVPQKRLLMQPHMHHPVMHGPPGQFQGPAHRHGHPMHVPHHNVPFGGHHPHHHGPSENMGRMPMQPHEPGMFKSEMGGGRPLTMKVASPQAGQSQTAETQQKSQEEQQGSTTKKQAPKKKGPDGTMDAASILLELRTSASPATVSSSGEQHPEGHHQEPKRLAVAEEDEEDDVPALASSSSNLSASMAAASVTKKQHVSSVSTETPGAAAKPPKKTFEQQHYEVPENYPTRLALPNDEAKLNSLHCFLRSELLEIFVVERSANKSPTHSPGSSVGRVGLRCVFCAMARKRSCADGDEQLSTTSSTHRVDEAPMAVFYPKSIAEIYRLVTSWQRCHLRKCRNLPPDIRSRWTVLRENDKSRGKTHYWITSAKEIGLVDCQSRAGGIRFCTSPGGVLKTNPSFASVAKTPNSSSSGALMSPSPAAKVAGNHESGEPATQDHMDCGSKAATQDAVPSVALATGSSNRLESSEGRSELRKGNTKYAEAQTEKSGNPDATNTYESGDGVAVQNIIVGV